MPAPYSSGRVGRFALPGGALEAVEFDSLLLRVRNAFDQLPGLSLSPDDGGRRWRIEEPTCRRVFEALRSLDYLVERPDGCFARRDGSFH